AGAAGAWATGAGAARTPGAPAGPSVARQGQVHELEVRHAPLLVGGRGLEVYGQLEPATGVGPCDGAARVAADGVERLQDLALIAAAAQDDVEDRVLAGRGALRVAAVAHDGVAQARPAGGTTR